MSKVKFVLSLPLLGTRICHDFYLGNCLFSDLFLGRINLALTIRLGPSVTLMGIEKFAPILDEISCALRNPTTNSIPGGFVYNIFI